MATISSLTELTTTASADKVAIDDASADQTKYVSIKNLTGHGYGHIYIASGSAISHGNISGGYTAVLFSGTGGANGEAGGTTADYTTNTITLPSAGGLFKVEYYLVVDTAGASDTVTTRVYDGSALVNGTEMSFDSPGTNKKEVLSGSAIYSSTGSEALVVQIKSSGTNTVTVDAGSFVVTPIPASA